MAKLDSDARNYKFYWDLLGDLSVGRPNLGNMTRVEVYRLTQFTIRDVIEKHYGTEAADMVFYEAGVLAGTELYKAHLSHIEELSDFIKALQDLLQELGIGILRIEKLDLEAGELIMTVAEDLDCSGLPENGIDICIFDEGFIAGLLKCFLGIDFKVKEIDCWCTGDRTCRFQANKVEDVE